MKSIILILGVIYTVMPIAQAKANTEQESSVLKSSALKSFVLENFVWTGKLPAQRKVKVVNHYGNIAARIRSENKIGVSASIQKIGATPAIPSFDIDESPQGTVITVVYPNGQFDTKRKFTGRVDIAVTVPETVSVDMYSTWGTIKANKHFSNLSATTTSGNIVLGSVGELNAHSRSGNIKLDFYNINWQQPQSIESKLGNIFLTLSKHANVKLQGNAHNISSNYLANTIKTKSNASSVTMSFNNAKSALNLDAPKGNIELTIIDKPHGGYIQLPREGSKLNLPTEFNGDLRNLPTVPAWKPGDPIREQQDKGAVKKDNKSPQGRGSTQKHSKKISN